VLVSTLVFALAPAAIAWRIMFFTGALPALLVFYLRRRVTDATVPTETTQARGSFPAILRGDLGRTTFFAALLATGVQGGLLHPGHLAAHLPEDRAAPVRRQTPAATWRC